MLKTCTICGKKKDENQFFYRNKTKGVLHKQCKACYSAKRHQKWREYYYRHGNKYRENAVKRNRRLKNELRKKMYEYLKDKACEQCGYSNSRALEFDHIDPKTKSFSIARGISDTLKWGSILAEIQKCQILCANCHKIKTSIEQSWYKNSNNP